MDREVIKQKIEKLLALSESTNENEALSAARTARKLMLKYHISMAEGERADRERTSCSFQVSIKELRFKRIPIRQQHLMLAFILAKNFRCKTFYQYGKTPCVKFIGFEEDTLFPGWESFFGVLRKFYRRGVWYLDLEWNILLNPEGEVIYCSPETDEAEERGDYRIGPGDYHYLKLPYSSETLVETMASPFSRP